jgi:hypothetical protein
VLNNDMEELKDIDKLIESITFRCPEFTKHQTDKLSPAWKKKLNESLLIATARILHDASFDPTVYLKSE